MKISFAEKGNLLTSIIKFNNDISWRYLQEFQLTERIHCKRSYITQWSMPCIKISFLSDPGLSGETPLVDICAHFRPLCPNDRPPRGATWRNVDEQGEIVPAFAYIHASVLALANKSTVDNSITFQYNRSILYSWNLKDNSNLIEIFTKRYSNAVCNKPRTYERSWNTPTRWISKFYYHCCKSVD